MERRSRSRSRSPSRSRSRSPPGSYRRRRSYSPRRGYPQPDYYRDPYYDRPGYYDRGYSYGPSYDREEYYRGYNRSSPPPRPKRYEVIKGSDEDRNVSTCLYVGNLPYSFVEEDVRGLFEKCGRIVSVSVPIDRITTRNKGFAFLQFEQRSEAQDAKEMFDSFQVEGRRLRIDWDIGREKKDVVKGVSDSGARERIREPLGEPRDYRDTRPPPREYRGARGAPRDGHRGEHRDPRSPPRHYGNGNEYPPSNETAPRKTMLTLD